MKRIINDIDEDFRVALEGIKQLLNNLINRVCAAYLYYFKLTTKIEYTPLEKLLNERILIPMRVKICTLVSIYITNKFKLA